MKGAIFGEPSISCFNLVESNSKNENAQTNIEKLKQTTPVAGEKVVEKKIILTRISTKDPT
jgi:hypothetical protein